eukprot:74532_1
MGRGKGGKGLGKGGAKRHRKTLPPPPLEFYSNNRNNVTNNHNNNNNNTGWSCGNSATIDKRINYLQLDQYMIQLDEKSLNLLTTAQLMQRLRCHGLAYKGLKHELIERWKNYKLSQINK